MEAAVTTAGVTGGDGHPVIGAVAFGRGGQTFDCPDRAGGAANGAMPARAAGAEQDWHDAGRRGWPLLSCTSARALCAAAWDAAVTPARRAA